MNNSIQRARARGLAHLDKVMASIARPTTKVATAGKAKAVVVGSSVHANIDRFLSNVEKAAKRDRQAALANRLNKQADTCWADPSKAEKLRKRARKAAEKAAKR